MSGWEDLETPPVAEPNPKRDDLDIWVVRTFATEEGKKVLAWLREQYLESPAWQPGAESTFGYWREGQNSVIRDLEKRIARMK